MGQEYLVNSQITDSPTKIFGNKQKTTESNRCTMGISACEKRINKKDETQNTEKMINMGSIFWTKNNEKLEK